MSVNCPVSVHFVSSVVLFNFVQNVQFSVDSCSLKHIVVVHVPMETQFSAPIAASKHLSKGHGSRLCSSKILFTYNLGISVWQLNRPVVSRLFVVLIMTVINSDVGVRLARKYGAARK